MLQVKLNGDQDFINLDETLVDLKLGPEVLEVPVPRFFREDRAKVGGRCCPCFVIFPLCLIISYI